MKTTKITLGDQVLINKKCEGIVYTVEKVNEKFELASLSCIEADKKIFVGHAKICDLIKIN